MNETQTAEGAPIHLTAKELALRWRMTLNALYTARSKADRDFPPGFRRGRGLLFPLAGVLEHERKCQMADRSFNPDLDASNAPVELRPTG